MSEKKERKLKSDKIRTSIDVSRERWAFVKSESVLTDKTVSDIVDEALEAYEEKRKKGSMFRKG